MSRPYVWDVVAVCGVMGIWRLSQTDLRTISEDNPIETGSWATKPYRKTQSHFPSHFLSSRFLVFQIHFSLMPFICMAKKLCLAKVLNVYKMGVQHCPPCLVVANCCSWSTDIPYKYWQWHPCLTGCCYYDNSVSLHLSIMAFGGQIIGVTVPTEKSAYLLIWNCR